MGELLTVRAARGRARSLNELFGERNFEATRERVIILRTQHSELLKAPTGAEHGRKKRQRSLRFAAGLLTDNFKFKQEGNANDPSGGQLRGWLHWLMWLELQGSTAAVLVERGQPIPDSDTKPRPHNFILRTIAAALEDEDARAIVFDWDHHFTQFRVEVDWDDPTEDPDWRRTYQITVKSKRSSHPDVQDVDPDAGEAFDPEP